MFKHTEIEPTFKNVRKSADPGIGNIAKYIITAPKGDIGHITHSSCNYDWGVYVDNFPGSKKYFRSNFPIRNAAEFAKIMKRLGLQLIFKSPS